MRSLVVAALLALATIVGFGQVPSFDFVNLDDPLYVTDNAIVRQGLTAEGLAWAFTTNHASNWHPLTWISHMLDCEIWGVNAAGHHLTNLLLHALNACLLFTVLRAMTARTGPSALAAAIFALHPLRVEAVAWVAERKELLATACGLAAIGAWVAYARSPGAGRYLLATGLFAAGLLAKPMLVTLPFVLLLLDHWPLDRRAPAHPLGRRIVEKVPWVLLAAASCAVTLWVQHGGGAVKSGASFPFGLRLANAAVSYVRYLQKTIWPSALSISYPHPALPDGEPLGALQIAGAVFVLAALSALVWRSRERRYLPVGWLWFLGALVPVIGLVQVGTQAMADRYTYLPSIGLALAFAWGASDLLAKQAKLRPTVPWLALAALVVLVPLGVRSWFQTRHWRDSFALYEHALALNPKDTLAHVNLAAAFAAEQMVHDAAEHDRAALAVDPRLARAHLGLANALRTLGETKEAERHLRLALDLEPGRAVAHFDLALLLRQRGRTDEAIDEYRRAIEIDPDHADARTNLGAALLARGDTAGAIVELESAVALRPDHARAQNNLAVALVRAGRSREALAHFERAAAADPSWTQPLVSRAWLLATAGGGDPTEAIRLATRAAELSGRQNPVILDALAVAYAAAGRYDEAVATAEEALALAESTGGDAVAAALRERLSLLRTRGPLPAELAPIP